jgi:hypothetical protein
MAETPAYMLWKRILSKRAVYRASPQKPTFCHSPLTDLENDLLRALIRVGPFIDSSDEQGREAMQIAESVNFQGQAGHAASPSAS